MELIWTFVAGIGVGAGIAWALHWIIAGHLRAELAAAQEAERARSEELAAARDDAEAWRERLQDEQLARTRFETEARRTPELVQELQYVRADLGKAVAEQAALRAAAERVPGLEGRVRALGEEVTSLKEVNAQLQVRMDEQTQAHTERIALLSAGARRDREVPENHRRRCPAHQPGQLPPARQRDVRAAPVERRRRPRGAAEGHRDAGGPLRETLQATAVEELEKARAHAYGALTSEIKGVAAAQNAVRAETAKLVNALRAAPKTRGRWGEQTLRNVLELSGLSAHCDFATEQSFASNGDGGPPRRRHPPARRAPHRRRRQDLAVGLPGRRRGHRGGGARAPTDAACPASCART